jgi:hypothetical protein
MGSVLCSFFFRFHNLFDVHGTVEVVDLFLREQQVFHAVNLHAAGLGEQPVHQQQGRDLHLLYFFLGHCIHGVFDKAVVGLFDLNESREQAAVLAFLVLRIHDPAHVVVQLHQTLAEELLLGIQVGIVRTVELIHIVTKALEVFDRVHHVARGINQPLQLLDLRLIDFMGLDLGVESENFGMEQLDVLVKFIQGVSLLPVGFNTLMSFSVWLSMPATCSTGNTRAIPVPGSLNRPASLMAERIGSTMASLTRKRTTSVRMSRLSPKNVFASPAPVPEAGMMVAPVAPAFLAESTTWSVRFGFTIARMHLFAIDFFSSFVRFAANNQLVLRQAGACHFFLFRRPTIH